MDWKGGRREYGQDAVEHSSVKREIFRTPVGACLFVRNRMRKGSGERKGERRELPKQYVDHSPGVKGGDRPERGEAGAGGIPYLPFVCKQPLH